MEKTGILVPLSSRAREHQNIPLLSLLSILHTTRLQMARNVPFAPELSPSGRRIPGLFSSRGLKTRPEHQVKRLGTCHFAQNEHFCHFCSELRHFATFGRFCHLWRFSLSPPGTSGQNYTFIQEHSDKSVKAGRPKWTILVIPGHSRTYPVLRQEFTSDSGPGSPWAQGGI